MSYEAWSVTFGEQPTASKWNILGTNDAAFNDGTGIAAAAIVSSHLDANLAAGWIAAGETWTYASANTFTISGDKTTKYQIGDKIKLTQTTVKYYYVRAVSYSAPNTTITIIGTGDYPFANAAITDNYFSKEYNPQGFPGRFIAGKYFVTMNGKELIQYGWDFLQGDNTNRTIAKAISFPIPYSEAPLITIVYAGAKSASDPTAVSELTVTTSITRTHIEASYTTGFNALVDRVSLDGADPGVLSVGSRYGFVWHARGVLA